MIIPSNYTTPTSDGKLPITTPSISPAEGPYASLWYKLVFAVFVMVLLAWAASKLYQFFRPREYVADHQEPFLPQPGVAPVVIIAAGQVQGYGLEAIPLQPLGVLAPDAVVTELMAIDDDDQLELGQV